MKAYLIDPRDTSIKEVDCDGSMGSIADALECRYFDVIMLQDGDWLFIDANPLLNDKRDTVGSFTLSTPKNRFGNGTRRIDGLGLVLGNVFGRTVDAISTVEDLTQRIAFDETRKITAG